MRTAPADHRWWAGRGRAAPETTGDCPAGAGPPPRDRPPSLLAFLGDGVLTGTGVLAVGTVVLFAVTLGQSTGGRAPHPAALLGSCAALAMLAGNLLRLRSRHAEWRTFRRLRQGRCPTCGRPQAAGAARCPGCGTAAWVRQPDPAPGRAAERAPGEPGRLRRRLLRIRRRNPWRDSDPT